jgi:integrase
MDELAEELPPGHSGCSTTWDRHRLAAYGVVSLLAGLRTEEARTLRWSEADLEEGTDGSGLANTGRTTAWSSAARKAPRWTAGRSAASSLSSPEPRAWEAVGATRGRPGWR